MTAPVSDEWVATTMTAEWANYVNRMSHIGEPTRDRMRRAWEAGFHIAIAALVPLIAAAEQRGREQAAEFAATFADDCHMDDRGLVTALVEYAGIGHSP